jgi:hypothetical protein
MDTMDDRTADRISDTHHIHIQMDVIHEDPDSIDVIHEDPDSIDVHTVQRRIWCLAGMDHREALHPAQEPGNEIGDTQARLADREADAHRG